MKGIGVVSVLIPFILIQDLHSTIIPHTGLILLPQLKSKTIRHNPVVSGHCRAEAQGNLFDFLLRA